MLSRAVLALLPLLTLADERALKDGYNYNRCDAKGPQAWPDDCLDQENGLKGHGTPIDLCGAIAFPDDVPVIDTMGYDTPVDLTVSSDGTSIKVTVSDNSTRPGLTAGKLSTVVGRSDEDTEFTWHLEQMHLHWGRDGKTNEGSEHFMQGKAYAAEAHFVHYNSKYGNFGDAVSAGLEGNDDALLVVGFFLEPGATDSEVIQEMASKVKTISKEEQSLGAVDLSDLMGDLSRATYYSYAGGLTTPGCWEIVTWIVITEPQSITTASLNALWDLKLDPKGAGNSEKISLYGNYRNLQPIAGRSVYLSSLASGRTSAACTLPADPAACTRTTSAGFTLIPSLLLPFTILFFFATVH